GLKEDCESGHYDHCAFKASREEGDPLVTVQELGGSWLRAELETEHRESHGDHVDARFGRIRENSSRLRHYKGRSFGEQHCYTNKQGEPHREARFQQLLFVSLCSGANHRLTGHALYPRFRCCLSDEEDRSRIRIQHPSYTFTSGKREPDRSGAQTSLPQPGDFDQESRCEAGCGLPEARP